MTDVVAAPPVVVGARLRGYLSTFWGLLVRDARVLRREFVPFLLRTVMNPLMFVFVFTYVFPRTGQGFRTSGASINFATVLLPGLVAVAIFFQGIAAVALPLANEFAGTREIEDRVMAPVPVPLVAFEKITFSALQSIVATLMVFPLVYLIPTQSPKVSFDWPLLVLVVLLASFMAGSLGLVLGTIVEPRQIGLIFSIVVIPVTFLGCVYYAWSALHPIRWLQIAVLANPLVYVSEGLRAALTPGLPHMREVAFLGASVVALAVLMWLGMRGFVRRTVG